MVDNIARDSQHFLYLAFVILCGFAFSLRILFRHTVPENNSELDSSNVPNAVNNAQNSPVCGSEVDAQEAFGSPWRSLATLFYALLGDFDPAVSDSCPLSFLFQQHVM